MTSSPRPDRKMYMKILEEEMNKKSRCCEEAGRSVRGSEPLLRLSIQSVLLLGDGDRLVEHGVLKNVSL